jgi:hypothetical protein
LEDRVVKPLQQLLDAFHSPGRLIQKRTDKLLDYSASSQKAEKNKETSKNRIVSIEDLNLFPTIKFSKKFIHGMKTKLFKGISFFTQIIAYLVATLQLKG